MRLRCYFSFFVIHIICLLLISCATQRKVSDNQFDIMMKIGNSAVANGSYNIAIPIFRRACQVAPSNSEPYAALGKCYLAQGDKEQARVTFIQALQRDRHDIIALRGLAKTDLLLNNLQWAATYIQEVLKKQHTDAETLNMLGVLLDLNGEHERAQSCYLTGLRSTDFADKLTLYNDYAISLALNGDYDKSISILIKAESTTSDPKVLHNINLIKNVRDRIMTAESEEQEEALRRHLANELMPQKNYSRAGKMVAVELSREYCQ
jgi:Flp pilus assembly protein TadD